MGFVWISAISILDLGMFSKAFLKVKSKLMLWNFLHTFYSASDVNNEPTIRHLLVIDLARRF